MAKRRKRAPWHKSVKEPTKESPKRNFAKVSREGRTLNIHSCSQEQARARWLRKLTNARKWCVAKHEFQMQLGATRIGPIVKMLGMEARKRNKALERKFIDGEGKRLQRWVLAKQPENDLKAKDDLHRRTRQRTSFYKSPGYRK